MKTVLTVIVSVVLGLVIAAAAQMYLLAPASPAPAPLPTPSSTSIAKDLAARISPVISKAVTDRKEDIIASAGGLPARAAVRIGFPVGIREIPTLTEIGCDAALDHLGSLSLPQLTSLVRSHNALKGRSTHPSIGSIGSNGTPVIELSPFPSN